MFPKIITLSILISTILQSAPARSIQREFIQNDGTKFIAKSLGNQHLNWLETKDGEILKYNKENKNFEYAKIENSMLKASGIKFQKNNSKRARSLAHINKINKTELKKLWIQKHLN